MLANLKETTEYLRSRILDVPQIAIVLGTGLNNLADQITDQKEILYVDIPHFPVTTVQGHQGKLIVGKIGARSVFAMQGRFHYYEGYSMQEVTYPIRVFQQLGVKYLFVSNASGGLHPDFSIGDIMMIDDHINLFPEHPLRGKNFEELGVRFPDMSNAYDKNLRSDALQIAQKLNISLQHGVYIGTQGPTFETPSEYNYFRIIGGDAVGMSTVPEVIVANHAGIKVFGLSVITDLGVKGKISKTTHQDVQRAAQTAQMQMMQLIHEMIATLQI